MATLKNRKTKSGHCVVWKSHPRHKRPSTYQISDSGLALFEEIGVSAPHIGDEVNVDPQVLRPLRILGDLHFVSETPGEVDLVESPVKSLDDLTTSKLSDTAAKTLRDYITHHPRYKAVKDELERDLSTLPDDSTDEPSDAGGDDEDEYVLPFSLPEAGDGKRPSTSAILASIPFDKEIREQLREWRAGVYTSIEELSTEELENTKYDRADGNSPGASYFANLNEVKWFANLCACDTAQVTSSVQRFSQIAEVYPVTYLSVGRSKGSLTYYFEEIQDVPFSWNLAVTEALDNGDKDYDYRFKFSTYVGSRTEIQHIVAIRNGYIDDWFDALAYVDYPEIEWNLSRLSPGGSHTLIYSRSSVLSHLEEIVAVLPDCDLEDHRTPDLNQDIEAIESYHKGI